MAVTRKVLSGGTQVLAAMLAMALGVTACQENILPDPDIAATAMPHEADVAVGTTHDILIAACQDTLTLQDLFMPFAVTAIFVGFGRLDAIFYLPGALVESAIPSCKTQPFTVSGAAVDGSAFSLEPTENPAAFRAHALVEGEARFAANVTIDGKTASVSTALRSWNVDRVAFAPVCTGASHAAVDWVPAGKRMQFAHRMYHGSLELAGYGMSPVTSDRLTILDVGYSTAYVEVAPVRGQFTLTSALDAAYSATLFAYDVGDIDSVSLSRTSDEIVIVGKTTDILPHTTVAGSAPCILDFPRQVTIETPAVCGFDGASSSVSNLHDDRMRLNALSPGVCRVRIDQPGTALTAVLEIPVFLGFEEVAIDNLSASESLEGMWAAGPDDLFIVGYHDNGYGLIDGLILRRAGGVWQRKVTLDHAGTLRAVHGVGPSGPVWAVGNDGVAARFDGTSWTLHPTGVAQDLRGVWVAADNDVWAVGTGGAVVHWDGATWTVVPTGTTAWLFDVWGPPGGGDPIVVGGNTVMRMTASGPQPVLPADLDVPQFDNPWTIDGSSQNDLWLVDREVALHFDGVSWTVPDFALDPLGDHLIDAWPVGDGFAYVLLARGDDAFVARCGSGHIDELPVFSLSDKIDGAGTIVWVMSKNRLFRYHHDPLIVFRP